MNKAIAIWGASVLLSACVANEPPAIEPSSATVSSAPTVSSSSSQLSSSSSTTVSSTASSSFANSSSHSLSSSSGFSSLAISSSEQNTYSSSRESASMSSEASSSASQWIEVIGGSAPAPSNGRRLTKQEYINTVVDAFGVAPAPLQNLLIEEGESATFRNDINVLTPSSLRTDAFEKAAIYVAENTARENLLRGLNGPFPCQALETFCFQAIITGYAERLFGANTLSDEVLQKYTALLQTVKDNGDDLVVGARLVLQGFLQSPQFLYRLESADNGQLTAEIIATRLSRFIWQAAPDGELLRKAKNGGFNSNTIEATVDAMLKDQRAERMLSSFVDDWLKLYLLDNRQFDTQVYPLYSAAVIQAMKAETLDYFKTLVFKEQAPFMAAYTHKNTHITAPLTNIYDVNKEENISWENTRERIGFMTQAAVLTAHAKSHSDTVVRRGLFVLDRLQCQPVPTLPAALQDQINASFEKIDHTLPQRERLALHNVRADCIACHQTFDGLGYAFESYNAFGEFSLTDQFGNTVEQYGTARIDGTDLPFSDVTDFANLMQGSDWAKRCVVEQSVRFAFGRDTTTQDDAMINALVKNFDFKQQNYLALIKEIALSEPFLKKIHP